MILGLARRLGRGMKREPDYRTVEEKYPHARPRLWPPQGGAVINVLKAVVGAVWGLVAWVVVVLIMLPLLLPDLLLADWTEWTRRDTFWLAAFVLGGAVASVLFWGTGLGAITIWPPRRKPGEPESAPRQQICRS